MWLAQLTNEIPLASLGTEGEAWLAGQIRAAARMVLLSRDASDKIRRAALRRAPAAIAELTPARGSISGART